jgi:hypothetical protein
MGEPYFLKPLLVGVIVSLTSMSFGAGLSEHTYYISADGSDRNDGVTKRSSWQHAPGMANCSAGCSAAVPKPGDRFIFRGGDTWHTSTGSVIGIPWTWTWSGTSTSPIYIGVDKTWFAGSSWSRPILSMDNPLRTDRPARCVYDDTNITAVSIKNSHFVNFDNFEFTGKCWSGDPNVASLFHSGTHQTISNSYFHGWTMSIDAIDDTHRMILGEASEGGTNNVIVGNVFDGSDSSLAAAPGRATGFAIYVDCYDVHDNIFRRLSNGLVCGNLTYVHDNLFEYMYSPVTPVHGNVVEALDTPDGGTAYFYNNVIRHTNEGVTIWINGSTIYNFNNVFYDIGNSTNCLMQNPSGSTAGPGAAVSHIYNNTFESPCHIRFNAANGSTRSWSGPVYFANNHFIGISNIASSTDCSRTPGCSIYDKGGQVFQNKAQVNAQGYTHGNNYAPTSANGATVGAGINLFAECGAARALCYATSSGVVEGPGHTVISPAIPVRSRNEVGPWNAGAY